MFNKKEIKKESMPNLRCIHKRCVVVERINKRDIVEALGYETFSTSGGAFRFYINIPYSKDYKGGRETHMEYFDEYMRTAKVCSDCKQVIDEIGDLRDEVADHLANVRLRMDKTVAEWKEAKKIYKKYKEGKKHGS